jgi:thiosulfate dehydrogenase
MKEQSTNRRKRSFYKAAAAVGAAGVLLAFGLIRKGGMRAQNREAPPTAGVQAAAIPEVSWKPPDPASIPAGPLGESIRMGRNIILDTPKDASAYVGNKMKCADCHLKEGTQAYASPLAGLTTIFPAYSRRDKRVITMERRIQECFERSENGAPPPSDSPQMVAIVSYMNWLSRGVPMGSTVKGSGLVHLKAPPRASSAAGQKIYAQSCAPCHGANGAGTAGIFPALWGPDSFNDGAGMSRVAKMAAFVKANMPQNSPGNLSVQQAFDVAAFVASKLRPHYRGAPRPRTR